MGKYSSKVYNLERCCNIQAGAYTAKEDASGVNEDQDVIMDTEGKAQLEGNKETEIIDEVVKALSELRLSENNDMDILNISTTQDYMDLEEDYKRWSFVRNGRLRNIQQHGKIGTLTGQLQDLSLMNHIT
ncbi:hypothetical protein Pst134EA_031391 [Puccinia striiformis f. sp. tritici]|uniref:uncharacterized protein n=1 Tax=Puccinia striiformis f. sp. tritici TaxID=168172 RepID=UPI00200835D5|nr:uncharacterized protein Pst134EA_031391 [Puccinia striiformis f. sp. tritici]KAH9445310.1 hypothetical protein Pst134EA_031391 [Puccinia striiformis f. sp. tritici]